MHIHKRGSWETQLLVVKQYIPGYSVESQTLVQIRHCSKCNKGKKRRV